MAQHIPRMQAPLPVASRGLVAGITVFMASAAILQAGGALVIRFDPGGPLGARNAEIRALQASGRRVELRGRCYSACTMYLGLPNTCVAPAAWLGFHGPSQHGTTLPPAGFEYWSQIMARNYREPLRSWFLREGRYRTTDYYLISGTALIHMGYPQC